MINVISSILDTLHFIFVADTLYWYESQTDDLQSSIFKESTIGTW